MADTEILLTGNATQLIAEIKKVEEQHAKQEEKIKQLSGTAKAAAQAELADIKAAIAIKKSLLSEDEKHAEMVRQHERLVKKGFLTQQESNAALKQQESLLVSGAKSMASFGVEAAVAITGINSLLSAGSAAARAFISDLDALYERQKRFRDYNVKFGTAVRDTLLNFEADETIATGKDVEDQILKVAMSTGATPSDVAGALSAAFSARGTLSNKDAVNAVEQAFRLAPGDMQTAKELATRSLDLSNISGSRDPREAMGLLLQAGSAARPEDIASFGRAAVPAIASAMSVGDSMQEATELFSFFTNVTGDKTGNTSGTATTNFAVRLAEFVPTEKAKDERGRFKVPLPAIKAYEEASNTAERLDILQRSESMRRQFYSKVSFGSESASFIKQLLESDPTVMGQLQSARDSISGNEGASERFEKKVADINDAPSQSFVIDSQRQVTSEFIQALENKIAAKHADAREVFTKAIESVDLRGPDDVSQWIGAGVAGYREWKGQDPAEVRLDMLQNVKKANAKNLSPGDIGRLDRDEETLKKILEEIREMRLQQARGTPVEVKNMPIGENPMMALGNR